jgi:tRNA-specific 2-thiouridylase
VVVGMSGGVDSSVAAALLVEAGYDVVGIAMRLWAEASDSGCCSLDDFLDARRVATGLGIPFYAMDFRDAFERDVVAPFVREYLDGRTPNPCVRCNQFVKFASFWRRARELGAEWVATGHYARIVRDDVSGAAQLCAAVDVSKDQSYFLFAIEPAVLQRTLFPVGGLTKAEVRARARALGLPVAEKRESQEVCFAPKGEYADFVGRYAGNAEARSGPIIDEDGRRVGRHEGVHRYTVGQRHGLGLSVGRPVYVTGIDAATATVRVGPPQATVAGGLVARKANWLTAAPPPVGTALHVKIRSRFAAAPVRIEESSPDGFVATAAGGLRAVTPGQAAVLYQEDRVIGGGWIERALPGPG